MPKSLRPSGSIYIEWTTERPSEKHSWKNDVSRCNDRTDIRFFSWEFNLVRKNNFLIRYQSMTGRKFKRMRNKLTTDGPKGTPLSREAVTFHIWMKWTQFNVQASPFGITLRCKSASDPGIRLSCQNRHLSVAHLFLRVSKPFLPFFVVYAQMWTSWRF